MSTGLIIITILIMGVAVVNEMYIIKGDILSEIRKSERKDEEAGK